MTTSSHPYSNNHRYYRKKEFVKIISKSTSFVEYEIRRGFLEWKRVGSVKLIPASEVSKYID